MLIDFSFSNFRSFRNKSTLNLTPANVRELSYSIMREKVDKEYRALCSSVIYGANANGKSNLLLAIEFLQKLILGGSIANAQRCIPVPLVPNFHNNKEPIELAIKFIYKQYLIEYSVSINGIAFLEELKNSFIETECLKINGKLQFNRQKSNVTIAFENTKLFNETEVPIIEKQAIDSLINDELFLTNGYKTLINKDLYSIIVEWFQKELIIIRNVNYVASAPQYDYEIIGDKNEDGVLLSDNIINSIAQAAGIDKSKIRFIKTEKEKKPQAISIIANKGAVLARFIESAGTMKLINFIPLIVSVMVQGATLVVDELDSSLHPSAVFSIVNAFHNNELNVNHAQLVFTTHNPIYQKAKIFRRDEIKFIERDDGESKIYNLSDFGTSGESGVKKSTDIMKNYLSGKYGAINYIDFSDVIHEAMEINQRIQKEDQ